VIWWRELDLPNRAILGFDGRIVADAPEGITSERGLEVFAELAGKTIFSAKTRIVELLTESGDLVGEIRNITHPVKFFEKGDKPLEIVSTRQWYIRNGGRDAALREKLIAQGKQLAFHPDFMRVRYENWVNGLTGDWLISRQRFFGVPIPVSVFSSLNSSQASPGIFISARSRSRCGRSIASTLQKSRASPSTR
jgi:valyl-tRNA synthetase